MSSSIEEILNITDLSELKLEDIGEEIKEDKGEEKIIRKERAIFDFSISLEERMNALNIYYQEKPQDILEITKKLTSIYCMSPVGIVRKFMYEIAKYSQLPIEIKMDCAITLADINLSHKLGLECMDLLFPYFSHFPTVCQLEYYLKLLNSELYCSLYKQRLIDFLVYNNDIMIEWRYKIILSLQNSIESTSDETSFEYAIRVCELFANNTQNRTSYRILACQNLLSNKQCISFAEELLLSFMNDPDLDHALRADSADVLLHYGSIETIKKAEDILKELGGENVILYDNKENVHTKEIEDSVRQIVYYLNTLNLSPIPTFDTVSHNIKQLAKNRYREIKYEYKPITHIGKVNIEQNHVQKIVSDKLHPHEEKIHSALVRIDLDRTIFKGINHTLQSVFLLLYTFIQTHDYKRELERRLLEELIDMAGTCTSGYISRLMNVLSGYTDYRLSIGWKDQITANLSGRLNAKLREHPDMDIILEQMTSRNIGDRSMFLKFFRENLLSIREEMYQEFKPYMEDLEWDEYFQQAVLLYDQT